MEHNDWWPWLQQEWQQPYFRQLSAFVHEQYEKHEVYPPKHLVFSVFESCTYKDISVVILGQDPYHKPGQAHGLCFSVNKGVKIPPSLANIYKEMKSDLGIDQPEHGYLADWARQGVLLLNATLTVRRSEPNSHKGKGWEIFTDRVIELLNEREKPMVFILWGANARAKETLITNPDHLILTGAHPSPLSAFNGFFGGAYFSRANRFLEATGQKPVDWQLKP